MKTQYDYWKEDDDRVWQEIYQVREHAEIAKWGTRTMNYYYELDERTQKAATENWRWWCMPNCSPAEGGRMNWKLHDELCSHSSRVWIENANGVYQVKPDWYGLRGTVCPREFTIIKLKAKTVEHE